MANIFIGQLQQKEAKSGEVYFTGKIANIPVKGFFDKSKKDIINLSLDAERIAWIDKQEVKKKTSEDKPESTPAAE